MTFGSGATRTAGLDGLRRIVEALRRLMPAAPHWPWTAVALRCVIAVGPHWFRAEILTLGAIPSKRGKL
jgi:hypothetical protein